MNRPFVEDQPRQYRNGFYSHASLRKPHRVRVVDVGGMAVVVLLIGAMFAIAAGLTLGAVWMLKTAWELLH